MDAFFGQPAISFKSQPALGSLLEALEGKQRITFMLGAGVSRDAGLPGWERLVSRIIELADDEDQGGLRLWFKIPRSRREKPSTS